MPRNYSENALVGVTSKDQVNEVCRQLLDECENRAEEYYRAFAKYGEGHASASRFVEEQQIANVFTLVAAQILNESAHTPERLHRLKALYRMHRYMSLHVPIGDRFPGVDVSDYAE